MDKFVVLGISKPKRIFKRKPWIAYPNDPGKAWWDMFQSLILLISCFTTPYNLAFSKTEETYIAYRAFIIIIDLCFFLDIVVSFNSAYENNML